MKDLKNLFVVSILFVTMVSSSLAMMGETTKQCDARYGKPNTTSTHISGETTRYYSLDPNHSIAVYFVDGIARYIMYKRMDGEELDETDIPFTIKWILPNRFGQEWDQIDVNKSDPSHPLYSETHYLRRDGEVVWRIDSANGLCIVQYCDYDVLKHTMIKR